MAELKWLPEAVSDLHRLHNFLQKHDQKAAARASGRILEGVKLLKASPRLGQLMSNATDRRELFMSFGAGAYVIRYLLESNDRVTIIRIWHSKENRTHFNQ
jgi:plasmid stabilization system protein ParE